ncbi:MAG TPA: lipocalin family protein [Opitutaceae bacterium]|nr:lipocalin family protein [Opitutaceae bacterium]
MFSSFNYGLSHSRATLAKRGAVLAALLASLVLLTACSTTSSMSHRESEKLRTVSSVDLERYLGRWNVISRTANFLEEGKVGTADVYSRRPDGKLKADYVFRKKTLEAPEKRWEGVAEVVNTTTNAEWRVQLFWPLWAEYRILELDPDYRWAVVASRGGKWLWVLARDTTLPETTYQDIASRLSRRGFNPEELVRVPQPQ